MDIRELIGNVADKSGLKKDFVAKMLDRITEEIIKTVVKGESVMIRGFGRFSSAKMAARRRVNPKTRVVGQSPAKTVPKFSASENFRERVAARRTDGGG